MKIFLILALSFIFISCSEHKYESRELPTKYSDSATMGSADDITKELYKK